jgi:hypothetical protein
MRRYFLGVLAHEILEAGKSHGGLAFRKLEKQGSLRVVKYKSEGHELTPKLEPLRS